MDLFKFSVAEVLGLIGTSAAVFYSARVYYLSRKQPNENRIFEEKIRCYGEIMKALNQALNSLITGIADAQFEKKHKDDGWREELDEIEEQLEVAIEKFEDVIYETSIFQPAHIAEKLSDYLKFFDVDSFFDKYNTSEKLEHFSVTLNEAYDVLIDTMREDLAFEKLDNSLRSRLGAPRPSKMRRRKHGPAGQLFNLPHG